MVGTVGFLNGNVAKVDDDHANVTALERLEIMEGVENPGTAERAEIKRINVQALRQCSYFKFHDDDCAHCNKNENSTPNANERSGESIRRLMH